MASKALLIACAIYFIIIFILFLKLVRELHGIVAPIAFCLFIVFLLVGLIFLDLASKL